MRSFHRLFGFSAALGLALLIGSSRGATYQPDDPNLPPPQFSVETRGPVHEAFAQPNEVKPELSVAIPKAPPPPLPEQPPEQRPDNPNMEWIPGYWAWDSDRNNFVWVSGTFRAPPPGRRWMPGHWSNTAEGWRFAPGFWIDENQKTLRYAPEPPAPLEAGPNTPPPDDNSTYIPGYWYYNDAEQRFVWRPGYWAPLRAGQMWTNPQYHWTPNGYAYSDGYWDYPLDDRGVLYAPAYFPTPLWNNPGWFYRPNFIVPLGLFFNSGFYRPGYNHFYFGNYYGNNYANAGYRPWWGGTNNPAFNHYAWQQRNNPQFVAQQQQLFNNRMNGTAARPPATFAQQQALIKANGAQGQPIVTPAAKFAPASGKMVPNTQLAAQNLQIRHVQDLSNLRANAERVPTKSIAPAGKNATAGLSSVKLPPAPPRIQPNGAAASVQSFRSGPPSGATGFNPALNTGRLQPGALGTGPRPFASNTGPASINAPKSINPASVAPPRLQSGGPPAGARPFNATPGISPNIGAKGNALPNMVNQPRPSPSVNMPRPAPTISTPSIRPSLGPTAAPALRSMPVGPPRSFSAPSMGARPSFSGGGPRPGGGFSGGGARMGGGFGGGGGGARMGGGGGRR